MRDARSQSLNGTLWFGDNLEILHEMRDEAINLIYLDPPFNSKADYNVLYTTPDDREPESQILAFEDTWHWESASEKYYGDLLTAEPKIASVMRGLIEALSKNDMTAYLVMMTIRLIELHRILKPTGSLYLHCDPTASHYLKAVLDAVFGVENFRNEIVWKRISGAGKTSQHDPRSFGRSSDSNLFYSKTNDYVFKLEDVAIPYPDIEKEFPRCDTRGQYKRRSPFRPPGLGARPNLCYEYKGVVPLHVSGWTVKKSKLKNLDDAGELEWIGGKVYRKQRPATGIMPNNIWTDINAPSKSERLGYQTQKPLALLERIITVSSNEGNTVLDPFCGCGTAVEATQNLDRRWVGIDMTHLAIGLIEKRMRDAFRIKVDVKGVPRDMNGAKDLANRNKLLFEHWAVMRISNMKHNKKQVADRGVDGTGYIQVGENTAKVIVSVKGGDNVGPSMVRDLGGTMDAEGTDFGILVLLAVPTRKMYEAAAKYGQFRMTVENVYDKLQIWTMQEYFDGIQPRLPSLANFAKASKSKTPHSGRQMTL